MVESQSSGYKTQDSVELGAQLNALPAQSRRLVSSYGDTLSAALALISAKTKASLKMFIAIITLIATAVFLTCAVWVSLQVLIAYYLMAIGLSLWAASAIVLLANSIAVYYLVTSAIKLFDVTCDELTTDLLDDQH